MVSVRLNKQQRETRQLTGLVLVIFMAFLWVSFLFSLSSSSSAGENKQSSKMLQYPSTTAQQQQEREPLKVLYIVTSSNEFNTGDKETQKGQDRFMEILVPVVVDGVSSITQGGFYQVDVVLILGYTLSLERQDYLQEQLQLAGSGLQVWNEATPLNYEYRTKTQRQVYLEEMPRALARQHRYVVKDKLPYYDYFLAFEDDMLITKAHIDYHWQFMQHISALKQELKETATEKNQHQQDEPLQQQTWFGPLTMDQLDHIKPGLLRVEVMTDPNRPTQSNKGPIAANKRARPDPRICCHADHVGLQGKLAPQYPTFDQLIVWETAIPALFVRPFPQTTLFQQKHNNKNKDEWMALLPIKGMPNSINGYWSGSNGALAPDYIKKPKSALNEFIGQSAGWMASQAEILELDQNLCKGQFLPPFSEPQIKEDGMGFMTDSVEYWSGGLQLWGQQCAIQRVVSLDPKKFSKHLIYHTANNKQKEIDKERLVTVATLLGQLYTVKQAAEAAMNHELGRDGILRRFFQWVGF